MIIDKLENAELYFKINKRVTIALEYLKSTDFESAETGRHNIDGDKIYALINDYTTKTRSEAKLESHRKYIDVQYVSSGSELIGYALLNGQEPSEEYDEEKDYLLYDEDPSFIEFVEGMFAILFPDDLHMPGIAADKPSEVKKIVVKVKI
jgi:YhcH/YjgK/YiaL family protein